MDTRLKQETVELSQMLEKWEEAYVLSLTRKANRFQDQILWIKKILNDRMSETRSMSEKEVKFLESLILEFQKKIEKTTEKLSEDQGTKKSEAILELILKKMK